jgi:hypothetical protein
LARRIHGSDSGARRPRIATIIAGCSRRRTCSSNARSRPGGTGYPPFAPILSTAQWLRHYGAKTWSRFAASSERFDPKNVLTPGAGVFSTLARTTEA